MKIFLKIKSDLFGTFSGSEDALKVFLSDHNLDPYVIKDPTSEPLLNSMFDEIALGEPVKKKDMDGTSTNIKLKRRKIPKFKRLKDI